jgi:hypothetical protein
VADDVVFEFPELRRFIAELRELPDQVRERLLKGTVATGASVIRKEAIQRAPVYTGEVGLGHPPPGTLKKAIYQTRLRELCTRNVEVWKVDVRRGPKVRKGQKDYASAAFYAAWVEFGHFARVPKSAGKTREARRAYAAAAARWVPAKPYMRPAFEAKKSAALDAMRAYFLSNLEIALVGSRFLRAR